MPFPLLLLLLLLTFQTTSEYVGKGKGFTPQGEITSLFDMFKSFLCLCVLLSLKVMANWQIPIKSIFSLRWFLSRMKKERNVKAPSWSEGVRMWEQKVFYEIVINFCDVSALNCIRTLKPELKHVRFDWIGHNAIMLSFWYHFQLFEMSHEGKSFQYFPRMIGKSGTPKSIRFDSNLLNIKASKLIRNVIAYVTKYSHESLLSEKLKFRLGITAGKRNWTE